MMPICWQGCYAEGWAGVIVPEAFAHPAKYSRALIRRLYQHLLTQGYLAKGDCALDPFAGVALGAFDAMVLGLRYVGVELEPRFVALGQANLAYWQQRYGFAGATLLQGDSRQLGQVLGEASVGGLISSPPYSGNVKSDYLLSDDGKTRRRDVSRGYQQGHGCFRGSETYGTTPGQLGAMPAGPVDAVVSSPPYAEVLTTRENLEPRDRAHRVKHGRNPEAAGGSYPRSYQGSPGNLSTAADTFWSAAVQVLAQCHTLLPPGAVAVWVTKNYVRDKRIVPFSEQWVQCCAAAGFTLVEWIQASLITDHGTEQTLWGESVPRQTARKSFFRTLAEKQGAPQINHEDVIIVRKL